MSTALLPQAEMTFRDPDRYEVIDGVRQELPPMGARESYLASFLSFLMTPYLSTGRVGMIVHETLFRLDAEQGLELRPDLAYLSADKWPLGRPVPMAAAWEIIPDVAIEVVSPSNTAAEVVRKVRQYFRVGVGQVWVIWPDEQQIYVYESPTRVRILTREDELTAEPLIPGFRLPLRDLFLSAPTG